MDKAIQNNLQKQLEAKKQTLETGLSRFASKDKKLKDDWDTAYPRIPQGNLEEAANEVEEYSTTLPIEHSLEVQLKDVKRALEKMGKGTYGVCEHCNTEIAPERLLAFPEAKTCAHCSISQRD